jgi:hypothetical protein
MPGTRILDDDEIADIVRDKKRLVRYIKQSPDKKHCCAQVISSLNQAKVTLKTLDELFFEGGYSPCKEAEYVFTGSFRGLLPQYGVGDLRQPGGHERTLRAVHDSLQDDLERLDALRKAGGRRCSEVEEEFAYKLTRSLEEQISRMRADQEGESTGYHLPQRPSEVPELPFVSQYGYTAAAAALEIKDAAFGLLEEPLKRAGYEL